MLSTVNLQVASLQFCMACREFKTLHVRVQEGTPVALWGPIESRTAPDVEASPSTPGRLSRVPVVFPKVVTWKLSVEALSCAISRSLYVEHLIFGDDFDEGVYDVAWPLSLLQLTFGGKFNQPVGGVVWPSSLEQLSFGMGFNQPVEGVVWPDSLVQLTFGKDFNHPIERVVWPDSLQQLTFGKYFD